MATIPQFIDTIVESYPLGLTMHGRGMPGVGKTDAVYQATEKLSEKYNEPFGLHVLHLSCIDSIDAEGIRFPQTVVRNDKEVLVSGVTRSPLLPPLDAPRRGLVFLDEVMQATTDVLKPVARFIHERKIGEHSLPQGWNVVCASNRIQDKSGVTRGMSFLTNRQDIVDIEGNLPAWVEWAINHEVHPLIVGFVKFKKGDVFTPKVPDDPDEPFMTPRTIVKAGEVLANVDDLTIASIMTTGLIGRGHSAELMAFVRMADQLPTYEEIVKKPDSAKLPEAPDARYAITQQLSSRVTPEDAVAVFKYLHRLPKEFQVACLKDAMMRPDAIASSLMGNKAFSEWVQNNSHLIMAASAGA